jgi:hypothetical protein
VLEFNVILAASVEPNIATAATDAKPRIIFDEELFLRTGRGEFSNFNISIFHSLLKR